MAMVVKNNQLATVSLGELNKNIREKGKQITRLATGQKIVGAADGASEWSISEKMRTQIRGLDQDIDNTKKGSSLLKVAAGGVENILEELRSIRELAINAANDHNSDADRLIIQKDIDQRKSSIEDIAVSTNYNGKPLLMGDYAKTRVLDYWTGGTGGTGGSGGNIGEDDIPAPYQPVSTGVIEPNDPPSTLPTSGNITTAGVYTIPTGFSGTITIADGLVGVKLQGLPSTTYSDIYIEGPAGGNANLWLENVNITNSQDKSAIKFSGSNNVLSIKGDNSIKPTSTTMQTKAVINVGGGLTLEGSGALTVMPVSTVTSGSYGATIGTDANDNTSSANITINSGTYTMTNSGGGAVIGSGEKGKIGNITINGGNFNLGHSSTPGWLGSYGSPIGAGNGPAYAGDIVINNAKIDAESYDATIGSGWKSHLGDITIANSWVKTISHQGSGIGTGENGSAKYITIKEDCLIMVKEPTGGCDPVGKGVNGTVSGVDNKGTMVFVSGGEEPAPPQHIVMEVTGKPLIIHTGTKANQHIRCYIEDMRPRALGILDLDVTTQKNAEFALGTMVKENWHHPTKKYEEATPDELNNPDNYMGSIDKAISYTLDQATMLGAYISRLDTTEANLTTNSENTQSSESVIRDADMAAEMTAMAKANILTQSSQAMLAQANQISSNVLDLLS